MIQTITLDQKQILVAAQALRDGKLVAFPTETVYGLGADASNKDAISRLYAAKGRPGGHPVIVHLGKIDELSSWAKPIPDSTFLLADKFWPGPLTLILKKADHVLPQLTGGQDTIGLRMPSHPIARALLAEFASGIAAPSANKFGKLSPTCAADVIQDLSDTIHLVLDGGQCPVGIESTIVDLSSKIPKVLRPGMISADEIEEALNCYTQRADKTDQELDDSTHIKYPGGLKSHYAPTAPVLLLNINEIRDTLKKHYNDKTRIGVLAFEDNEDHHPLWIKEQIFAPDYAKNLYRNLRLLDSQNVTMILVERVPKDSAWDGVADRLFRASTPR